MTNPIDLGKPGIYRMTLWTFLHCANVLCDTANDTIQIRIKEDGAPDYDKIIFQLSTEGNRKDREWILRETIFEASTRIIFVFFHIISKFLIF